MMEDISSQTDNIEPLVLERGSFCTLKNVFNVLGGNMAHLVQKIARLGNVFLRVADDYSQALQLKGCEIASSTLQFSCPCSLCPLADWSWALIMCSKHFFIDKDILKGIRVCFFSFIQKNKIHGHSVISAMSLMTLWI